MERNRALFWSSCSEVKCVLVMKTNSTMFWGALSGEEQGCVWGFR